MNDRIKWLTDDEFAVLKNSRSVVITIDEDDDSFCFVLSGGACA